MAALCDDPAAPALAGGNRAVPHFRVNIEVLQRLWKNAATMGQVSQLYLFTLVDFVPRHPFR
jgi:hypothetical protein